MLPLPLATSRQTGNSQQKGYANDNQPAYPYKYKQEALPMLQKVPLQQLMHWCNGSGGV
jgi:hypothetical protein